MKGKNLNYKQYKKEIKPKFNYNSKKRKRVKNINYIKKEIEWKFNNTILHTI